MVLATSNNSDTEKHDLKSLPGGFIVARRLTWGEKLQRRAMVSNLKVQAQKGNKDFAGEMQMVNEKATNFDFQNCIVDHNLEKPNPLGEEHEAGPTVPLNFGSTADIKALDPRVGEEIDSILSKMNNFEEDEEGED